MVDAAVKTGAGFGPTLQVADEMTIDGQHVKVPIVQSSTGLRSNFKQVGLISHFTQVHTNSKVDTILPVKLKQ